MIARAMRVARKGQMIAGRRQWPASGDIIPHDAKSARGEAKTVERRRECSPTVARSLSDAEGLTRSGNIALRR
jgi:hypothetical protein